MTRHNRLHVIFIALYELSRLLGRQSMESGIIVILRQPAQTVSTYSLNFSPSDYFSLFLLLRKEKKKRIEKKE